MFLLVVRVGEWLRWVLQAKPVCFLLSAECSASRFHFQTFHPFMCFFFFRIFCDVAGHLMGGRLLLDLLIGTDSSMVVFLHVNSFVCLLAGMSTCGTLFWEGHYISFPVIKAVSTTSISIPKSLFVSCGLCFRFLPSLLSNEGANYNFVI